MTRRVLRPFGVLAVSLLSAPWVFVAMLYDLAGDGDLSDRIMAWSPVGVAFHPEWRP